MLPTANGGDAPDDSQPLNFATFVPTHDPSLEFPSPPHPPAISGPDYTSHHLPNPPGPIVSQDEAFTRALGAMYWGGYWTAVYHVSRTLFGRSRKFMFCSSVKGAPRKNHP